MLAEQQMIDGMPTPTRTTAATQRPIPAQAPTLPDERHTPLSSTVTMHLKGNPAQYDRDILRVIQLGVNAMTTLLSSRPEGNVTPLFTAGHSHYTRLALLPCLIDMARPYFTDDELTLLNWAQKTVHYEAMLRSSRQPLPTLNPKGLARLQCLGKRLQSSVDTLAVNAGMRRTAATRRNIAEMLGEDALTQVDGPVALV